VFPVYNPATGEQVCEVQEADKVRLSKKNIPFEITTVKQQNGDVQVSLFPQEQMVLPFFGLHLSF
jgi:hypothetical protein